MEFKNKFDEFIPELTEALTVPDTDDWTVKGFIDYYKNIYSISTDTKVVSKIIELLIFPKFLSFAKKNNFTLKLSPHQNYYPDITFIDNNTKKKYAVDLKSTYRVTNDEVNGLTLGAFTGYFRNRESTKNVLYPYGDYEKHYVFGILYSRTDIAQIEDYIKSKGISITKAQRKLFVTYLNETSDDKWEKVKEKFTDEFLNDDDRNTIDSFLVDEMKEYNLENFTEIQSVVKNFDFFLQEKWRLAVDRPGSGNTKNIGSENKIEYLKNGNGLFCRKFKDDGELKFDKYWMNYQTKDMAKNDGRDTPQYKNLDTFEIWVDSLNW